MLPFHTHGSTITVLFCCTHCYLITDARPGSQRTRGMRSPTLLVSALDITSLSCLTRHDKIKGKRKHRQYWNKSFDWCHALPCIRNNATHSPQLDWGLSQYYYHVVVRCHRVPPMCRHFCTDLIFTVKKTSDFPCDRSRNCCKFRPKMGICDFWGFIYNQELLVWTLFGSVGKCDFLLFLPIYLMMVGTFSSNKRL